MNTTNLVLREPLPHQKDAIKFCEGRNNPALFMEMRLGKTLVLIRWFAPRLERYGVPALVIAPTDVLRSWRKELGLEGQTYVDMSAMTTAERKHAILHRKPGVWYLCHYELIRQLQEIVWMRWALVVCDESTRIKNPTAKITKLCTDGFRLAHHRAILSGLPAPESQLELFCQFQFLHGSFLQARNFYNFRSTYFERSTTSTWELNDQGKYVEVDVPDEYFRWNPKDGVQRVIDRALQEKAFILTREQAGVGSKKFYETKTCTMSAKLRKAYIKVEKEFEFESPDFASNPAFAQTQWAMVAEGWLGRLAGGFSPVEENELLSAHKINSVVKEFTTGELKHEQAVIWCRFNAEIDVLTATLNANGITATSIDGQHSKEVRAARMDEFDRGKAQLLVAQGACARYGLDFSAGDVAIYYSNHYSCEIRVQSEDRIVHPTKKRPLLVLDYMTENTVDEEIVDTLQDKRLNAQALMQNLRAGIERRKATYK